MRARKTNEADGVLTAGPRPKIRKEGPRDWTKAKRETFFTELAATCNVAAAARAAGMSVGGVYSKRRQCAKFRAQWAAALNEGYAKLEMMLLERAIDGTVKTVTRKDGSVDKTHEYPNAIALSLLRQHKDAALAADAEHDPDEIDEARTRIARKLELLRARIEKEEALAKTDRGGDARQDAAGIEAHRTRRTGELP